MQMVLVLRLDILIFILYIKLLKVNISVSVCEPRYDTFGFDM